MRRKVDQARQGIYDGAEMEAVRPILELQSEWSCLPAVDELLIERVKTREGHHLFFYPMEGRLVHEGMAALFAYRLAQLGPITFTLAANDYGFELLSADPASLEQALEAGLVSPDHLLHDIPASLNAAELAKRQFREIARVAGLIFQGYPGNNKSVNQVQASSGLFTTCSPAMIRRTSCSFRPIARFWRNNWNGAAWAAPWNGWPRVASASPTWSGPLRLPSRCWSTGHESR